MCPILVSSSSPPSLLLDSPFLFILFLLLPLSPPFYSPPFLTLSFSLKPNLLICNIIDAPEDKKAEFYLTKQWVYILR